MIAVAILFDALIFYARLKYLTAVFFLKIKADVSLTLLLLVSS